MDGSETLGQAVLVPVMDPERFAQLSGVEYGVLLGWMNRDYIPTVKIGKRRLVNVAKLNAECLSGEQS